MPVCLFQKTRDFLKKIIAKSTPGRVLGLYSSMISQISKRIDLELPEINSPYTVAENKVLSISPTIITLKCSSQNDEKFKNLISYLSKNTQLRNTLIIVNSINEANSLTKKLKMKSMTSYNLHDYLSID